MHLLTRVTAADLDMLWVLRRPNEYRQFLILGVASLTELTALQSKACVERMKLGAQLAGTFLSG